MRGRKIDRIEHLFLSTLKDLETRISSHDDYTILGVSALIRKLLIDDFPLIDQINPRYRIKLTFEISDFSPPIPKAHDPALWSVQDGLDPETLRHRKARKSVSTDQLLSTVLAVANGESYTLRGIIKFEANVMSGVHAGTTKEQKEKSFEKINNALAIGGYRASLRQLQAIGRVVLRGLQPLKKVLN